MAMESPTFAKNAKSKYGRRARPLNKFGDWCMQRSITGPVLDQTLGVGKNHSYRYIVPLDHPRFAVPRPAVMSKIVALTEGAIQPNDFYAPAAEAAA